jgi:hypothetical protein
MTTKVDLWDAGGLHIWAEINSDKALTISGQDLHPPGPFGDEYEYVLTVAPADIDTVVVALGGAPGDDVLPLLKANGPMIKNTGEQAWLQSLGITPELWNWY